MSEPRIKVRVTKHSDGSTKYEVLHNQEKIADASAVEVLEMALQFASSVRFTLVK